MLQQPDRLVVSAGGELQFAELPPDVERERVVVQRQSDELLGLVELSQRTKREKGVGSVNLTEARVERECLLEFVLRVGPLAVA